MTISVYIPLLLSLVLAALSRPLARWLSPRTAAPALVIAAGLSAAASTWGLILLAATLLHQAPPVAERAATGTHLPSEPVPGLIAAAPGAVLAVGAYRLTEVIKGRRATHRTLRGLCEPSEAAGTGCHRGLSTARRRGAGTRRKPWSNTRHVRHACRPRS